ncbi:hypothetical protein LPJGGPFB_03897 [Ensifer adhaerens]|nr:hypothetical protein [Ensifer adhaerens]
MLTPRDGTLRVSRPQHPGPMTGFPALNPVLSTQVC